MCLSRSQGPPSGPGDVTSAFGWSVAVRLSCVDVQTDSGALAYTHHMHHLVKIVDPFGTTICLTFPTLHASQLRPHCHKTRCWLASRLQSADSAQATTQTSLHSCWPSKHAWRALALFTLHAWPLCQPGAQLQARRPGPHIAPRSAGVPAAAVATTMMQAGTGPGVGRPPRHAPAAAAGHRAAAAACGLARGQRDHLQVPGWPLLAEGLEGLVHVVPAKHDILLHGLQHALHLLLCLLFLNKLACCCWRILQAT